MRKGRPWARRVLTFYLVSVLKEVAGLGGIHLRKAQLALFALIGMHSGDSGLLFQKPAAPLADDLWSYNATAHIHSSVAHDILHETESSAIGSMEMRRREKTAGKRTRLDSIDAPPLVLRDQSHSNTSPPSARCTAYTMHICSKLTRHLKVDDDTDA
jgi:hypothetical protein